MKKILLGISLLVCGGAALASYVETPYKTKKGGTESSSQTANRAVTTDGSGHIVSTSSTTDTEIGYVNGVTAGIQGQLNNKASIAYVDGVAQGLQIKPSVRAAEVVGVPLAEAYTYLNGVTGLGATITSNDPVALEPIDGVTLVVNDRVLIDQETGGNAIANGIYTVTRLGGATTFVLTRATDSDGSPPSDLVAGIYTFVEEGTINKNSGWVINNANPIHVGSDPIYWTQFSGAGQITAGNGLNKEGNLLSVVAADASILSNGSGIAAISSVTGGIETLAGSGLAVKLDGGTLSEGIYGLKLAEGGIADLQISTSAAINLSKLATVTGSRALESDAGGHITASSVTNTELGYVGGVTAGIQGQLNGKQGNLTFGDITSSTSQVTLIGGTGSVIGSSGVQIRVATAGAAATGLLTSQDWNTFNGKQNAGDYITGLSGDVSATGPGVVGATVNYVGGSSASDIHAAAYALTGITGNVLGGYLNGLTNNVQTQINNVVSSTGNYVPLAGGTMTGDLVTTGVRISSTPPQNLSYLVGEAGEIYTSSAVATTGFTNAVLVAQVDPSFTSYSAHYQLDDTEALEGSTNGVSGWTQIDTVTIARSGYGGSIASVTSAVIPITYPYVRVKYTPNRNGGTGQVGMYARPDSSGDLNNTFFNLPEPDSSGSDVFCVWFNVDGAGIDPCGSGIPVMVGITANSTKGVVAGAVAAAVSTATDTGMTQPFSGVFLYGPATPTELLILYYGSSSYLMPNDGSSPTGFTIQSLDAPGKFTMKLNLSSGGSGAADLKFQSGSYALTVEGPAGMTSNVMWTLPPSQGAASTALINDGSGNLSWQLPGITSVTGDVSIGPGVGVQGATVNFVGGSSAADIHTAVAALAGVTGTTLGSYLNGLTANVQSQLDGKQGNLTFSDITSSTSQLTITGGTGAIIGASGVQLSIATAGAAATGLLTSADWGTFNGKQNAGDYITGLSGDVSASGPGLVGATVNYVGGISAANIATVMNSLSGATTASIGAYLNGLTADVQSQINALSSATVDVAHGGTGLGSVTANALLIGNGTGALIQLPPGAEGAKLKIINGIPTWQQPELYTVIDGGDTGYMISITVDHIRSGTTLTQNQAYTLPACSANIGERHVIKNLPTQTFKIVVTASGTDKIDGVSTYDLDPGDSVSVICAFTGLWDIQ